MVLKAKNSAKKSWVKVKLVKHVVFWGRSEDKVGPTFLFVIYLVFFWLSPGNSIQETIVLFSCSLKHDILNQDGSDDFPFQLHDFLGEPAVNFPGCIPLFFGGPLWTYSCDQVSHEAAVCFLKEVDVLPGFEQMWLKSKTSLATHYTPLKGTA